MVDEIQQQMTWHSTQEINICIYIFFAITNVQLISGMGKYL